MGFSQNWDSLTPPALPSGWTFDAPFATATIGGSITPTSSPNVLEMTPVNTNTIYYATFGTLDGAGGNVTVQANFAVVTIGTHCRCGIMARGSAYPLSGGSTSFYRGLIGFDTGNVSLQKVVSGAITSLQTVSWSPAITTWYTPILSCNGSNLTLSVQRWADGYWLNSSGSFQSGATTAISLTDSSISGQGYSGLTVEQNDSSPHYVVSDDWSLTTLGSVASIYPSVTIVPTWRNALHLTPGIRQL